MGAFKGALFKYLKINVNNINALSLLFVPIITIQASSKISI